MAAQAPTVEKAPHPAHNGDLESQHLNLMDSEAGASLRRQISVQLTAEQFERLYLQPGGAKAKGDLAKVRSLTNPTTVYLPEVSVRRCGEAFSALTEGSLVRSIHSASVTLPRSESPPSCCL